MFDPKNLQNDRAYFVTYSQQNQCILVTIKSGKILAQGD